MPISRADADEARTIKANVTAGRLNGSNGPGMPGNPGFQEYANAGGHGATILPAAAGNEAYYEYRLGGAVAPAAGFGAGAGAAGIRRMVLLVSPIRRFDILDFCHIPATGGGAAPAAIRLPMSASYPALLTLRTNQTEGAAVNPPYAGPAALADAVLAAGQELRTIQRTLTGPPRNRENVPTAPTNITLYFRANRRTTYQIHRSYYTDDHYVSFSDA